MCKTCKTLQDRDLKLKYCTKMTNYLLKLANQIHSHQRHESFDKRVIPMTMNDEYNTSQKSPSLFANWPFGTLGTPSNPCQNLIN